MKTYALFLVLCLAAGRPSSATIKNGYHDIDGARTSLRNLQLLLKNEKGLSMAQRQFIKQQRKNLLHYITYHEFTSRYLQQFRLISWELYAEIDSLKSRDGKTVDVYVRFVPEYELSAGVAGVTNINQDESNPHTYRSEYGVNTVSVTVRAETKSMILLAHEFGHVLYQAQHLSEYMDFYSTHYGEDKPQRKSIGHNDNDASGWQARNFMNRFHENYKRYIKLEGRKLQSHTVVLADIARQLKNRSRQPLITN